MMFSIGDIIWSWWPLIENMDAIAETNERMMRHEEMQKKRKELAGQYNLILSYFDKVRK